MIFTHITLSCAQSPLPRATSREALCIYSFLAHISCIGNKVYPLLHISEYLQNSNIYFFLFFLILHQFFIETYHGFNQILRGDLLPYLIGFCLRILLLLIISQDILIMFIRVISIIHVHHFLLKRLSLFLLLSTIIILILRTTNNVHH